MPSSVEKEECWSERQAIRIDFLSFLFISSLTLSKTKPWLWVPHLSICKVHALLTSKGFGKVQGDRIFGKICKLKRTIQWTILDSTRLKVQLSTGCRWAAGVSSGMAGRFRFVSQLSPTGGGCLEFHVEEDSEALARICGREYWYWLLMSAMDKGVGELTHLPYVCSFFSSPVSPNLDDH